MGCATAAFPIGARSAMMSLPKCFITNRTFGS
jgi:hypothetical protein